MSDDDTPVRVPEVHVLPTGQVAIRDGAESWWVIEPEGRDHAIYELPDDAVELRAAPAGREDMCSLMGCGLDRGSVVNELSRLLRGMARRVGDLRNEVSADQARDELARVTQEAVGLRLTVAAQVRQLGVLDAARKGSDALIADLRTQVAASGRNTADTAQEG